MKYKHLIQFFLFVFISLHANQNTTNYSDGYLAQTPRIYYKSMGEGDRTIIILHGGPGVAHDYLVPEWSLLSKNNRIIFYDQRGCGYSDTCDSYTWRDHVDDLHHLIEHLVPKEKVILAGSSWGSFLALLYNMLYPDDVETMVLSGIVPYSYYQMAAPRITNIIDSFLEIQRNERSENNESENETDRPKSITVEATREIVPMDILPLETIFHQLQKSDGFVQDSLFFSRHFHPLIANRIFNHSQRRGYNDYVFGRTTNSFYNDLPHIEDICKTTVPTLLLRGNNESEKYKDGAPEFSSLLENSTIISIEKADLHDPWLDQPELFIDAIEDFLSTIN